LETPLPYCIVALVFVDEQEPVYQPFTPFNIYFTRYFIIASSKFELLINGEHTKYNEEDSNREISFGVPPNPKSKQIIGMDDNVYVSGFLPEPAYLLPMNLGSRPFNN
jgi:hypothetical protein